MDNLVEQERQITSNQLQETGEEENMLEQHQEITNISNFRQEIFEHNHVKIGGKEKNKGRGDIVWLEQLSQITYKTQREIKQHYNTTYIRTVPSWAGSRKQRKLKRKIETVKVKMGEQEALLEQDEQITPPDEITKVYLSGRAGRDGENQCWALPLQTSWQAIHPRK